MRPRTARQLSVAALAAVVLLGTIGLVPVLAPASAQQEGDPCARIAGDSRYATAAEIALDTFPGGAGTVLIARGDGTPTNPQNVPFDALAGSYAAGHLTAPILLTPGKGPLPDETIDAIAALGATSGLILGQEAAVSSDVEDELRDHLDEVDRVGGADRHETAALIAGTPGEMFVNSDGELSVFLASGDDQRGGADALSAGGPAYGENVPILLTASTTLSPAAAEFIEDTDVERVYILGGPVAVSAATEAQVRALNDGGTEVTRLQGADRSGTAVDVAVDFLINELAWPTEHFNLANGVARHLVDAVSGGPHSGAERSMTLLSQDSETLGEATSTFLKDVDDGELDSGETVEEPTTAHAFGGAVAVAEDTMNEACTLAGVPTDAPPPPVASSLVLTPESDVNPTGADHTVTARVTDDAGNPVEGEVVKFELFLDSDSNGTFAQVDAAAAESSGSNRQATATPATFDYDTFTGSTDTDTVGSDPGEATYTFTDEHGVGEYLVAACVDEDGDATCASVSASGAVVLDPDDTAHDTALKRFVASQAATAGTYTGEVVQDCSGSSAVPGGGDVGIFTTDDRFLILDYGQDLPPDTYKVNGADSNEAGFETACSLGDTLQSTYNPSAGSASAFHLTEDTSTN